MDDKSARRKRGSDRAADPPQEAAEAAEPVATAPRAAQGAGADIVPLPAGRLRRHRAGRAPDVRVEDHISRQLRALYQDVVTQPIPDRFVELLRQLEAGGPRPPDKESGA